MVWRPIPPKAYVEVCIDASDIGTQELLQSLVDRCAITPTEAEAILLRSVGDGQGGVDDPIGRARDAACRGDRAEALIWIERLLGGDFVGRLAPDHA